MTDKELKDSEYSFSVESKKTDELLTKIEIMIGRRLDNKGKIAEEFCLII